MTQSELARRKRIKTIEEGNWVSPIVAIFDSKCQLDEFLHDSATGAWERLATGYFRLRVVDHAIFLEIAPNE